MRSFLFFPECFGNIKELDLSWNQFKTFPNYFSTFGSLRKLSLCGIETTALKDLAGVLVIQGKITHLDLSDCHRLMERNPGWVSELIKEVKSLKSLL